MLYIANYIFLINYDEIEELKIEENVKISDLYKIYIFYKKHKSQTCT